MQELADKSKNDNSSIPVISKNKIDNIDKDKIKRTRMQNAIGTSGMFIKPWRTSDKSQQLPTRKGQKSNRIGKF